MLIYSLGALFLKGISFFLIPLYTRMLHPSDYGNLELLNTFTSILEIVCSLGLVQFLYMDYFHHEKEGRVKLMNTILSIYIGLSTLLYVITAIFIYFYHERTLGSLSLYLIYFGILTTYLNFFQGIYILVLKFSERAKAVTILQIAIGLLSMAMNIYFVYYLRTGISGIIWANLISMMISLIIIGSSLGSKIKLFNFTWDKEQINGD